MNIEYSLNHADVKAFAGFCMQQPAIERPKLFGWLFIIAVVAVAIPFYEEIVAFLWHGFFSTLLTAGGIVVVLVVLGSIYGRRQTAASIQGTMTARFAEDGLHHSDGDTRSVTRWEAVRRIGSSPAHLFVVFGHMKGLIIPKRAFDSDTTFEHAITRLGELCPGLSVETGVSGFGAIRKTKWSLGFTGVLLLLAMTPWMIEPLRQEAELPGGLGSLSYRVMVTGDADPEAELPLVVFLNPLAGFPEVFWVIKRRWDFPARVVVPRGPRWYLIGYSWFAFDDDWETFVADVRVSADQVAAFTRAMAERYPTPGKPIVTGFSQGGSLTYALAAYHPDVFAAAMPISGAMPGDLPKREVAPDILVHGIHGAEDLIVEASWAQYIVDQMREQGWNVTFDIYPEVGHGVGRVAGDAWRRRLAELTAEQAGLAPAP